MPAHPWSLLLRAPNVSSKDTKIYQGLKVSIAEAPMLRHPTSLNLALIWLLTPLRLRKSLNLEARTP